MSENKGISVISLIITIITIIIFIEIIISGVITPVNYKAVIQVGKDEYITVDVLNYSIYRSGMIIIESKDGKTYKTSNYTLIEN